jgi:type IV pilus assembly protein PilO
MKPNAMAISASLQKIDFQKILDDFRHMNPNDPGSWQLVPRVAVLCGVFFLILVLGWWFVWSDQLADLGSKENEERTLKEQFVEKKRQAVNLDLYTQQLAEIDRSFGALLKQLPNKSEIEALLIEVNQAGLGRGLQFELFRPSQEVVKDFYAEMPIVVKVNGGYHDFGAFAADIGKLPRIVTLNNLSIAPLKDGGSLTMDATIKTFRYLDDEEIAKQKKIADAKKAAQGAKK